MKILLATVLIIVGGFMSYVAIGGFLQKQNKEESSQTLASESAISPAPNSTPANGATKFYTKSEIATRNTPSDCWIIISNKVYSVSKYLTDHPGGASAIIEYCGSDATQGFATQNKPNGGGHSSQARSQLSEYQIGTLQQ